MRLTLRTLLAYLDDVLDPEDAEKLSKKIEESEFASELVHRIRGSIRHLRLTAPKVDGRGMGFDPNTVADYLDSTLPAEQVPDFEKICLESDVNLAEAAACHQILTLVLGEPAEADPTTRERMYRIIDKKDEKPSPAAKRKAPQGPPKRKIDQAAPKTPQPKAQTIRRAKKTNQRGTPPASKTGRANPSNSKSGLSTLAVALIVSLFVVGGLRLMGEFNESHPIISFFAEKGSSELAQLPPNSTPETADENPDKRAPGENAPAPEPANLDNSPDAQPPAPNHKDAEEKNQPSPPAPSNNLRSNNKKSAKPKNAPQTPQDNETASPSPEKVEPPTADKALLPDSSPPIKKSTPAVKKPENANSDHNKQDAEKEVSEGIGRYVSEEDVLLRYDDKTESWYRLPQRASLASNDKLMVLPTFRPSVLLSGIQLSFAGNNLIQLNKKGGQDMSLSVEYGRIILVAVGNKKTSIQLNLGGRSGVALFGDSDSALAVEVRSFLPPGENPESGKTQTVVELFTLSGKINWSEAGSKPVDIAAKEVFGIVGDQPGIRFSMENLPAWIESKEVNKVDRLASEEIAFLLPLDRPTDLALQELIDHRRSEIRSLAVRCLASFESYDPIVKILNDKWHQASWGEHFSILTESISRSPESAANIRKTFERLRSKDAESLYRLLWGFSNQQLEESEAKNLLLTLNHESLDFRVLAFHNLKQITGFTQGYRPEFTNSRRKRPLQRWIGRYEEGSVLHKVDPTPLVIPTPNEQSTADGKKPKKEIIIIK